MFLQGFQYTVSAECGEYADFLKNIEFKMTISLIFIIILPSMHITFSKMIRVEARISIIIGDWSLKPEKPTCLVFFWASLFLLPHKIISDWEYWNKFPPDFTSFISLPSPVHLLQYTQLPLIFKLFILTNSLLSPFLAEVFPDPLTPQTGLCSSQRTTLCFQGTILPTVLVCPLLFPNSEEIPVFLQYANKSSLWNLLLN